MTYQFVQHGTPEPCIVLNPTSASEETTIAIVGVPRGGTTMVAAAAHALGLELGPTQELAQFTFEDQTMNRSQPGLQLSYISRRNAEHKRWGWKDPSAISTVRHFFFALRNPRIIVVFRDMLASIEGEMRFDETHNITPRRTFGDLAKMTANWWQANLEFVSNCQFPVLLVSYERACRMPQQFVLKLAAFIGLTPTSTQLKEAEARINSQGGYLIVNPNGTIA